MNFRNNLAKNHHRKGLIFMPNWENPYSILIQNYKKKKFYFNFEDKQIK